jgi:acyl carrier protein
MDQKAIAEKLIRFISELKALDKNEITEDTLLISEGILDSISMLTMVNYMEENFKIEFNAHEVNHENLNTVNQMVKFILNKKN